MANSKLALGITAVVGWGLVVWLVTRPAPLPETKIVEKEVVKTVEVVKEVARETKTTTTKPDGTVIVKETSTKENSTTHSQEQSNEIEVAKYAVLTKWSLGVSVTIDPFEPLKRDYQIEIGRRLWQTPAWITAGVTSKKELLLGLRYEF